MEAKHFYAKMFDADDAEKQARLINDAEKQARLINDRDKRTRLSDVNR